MKEPNTILIRFNNKPQPKQLSLTKPNPFLFKNHKHSSAYNKNSFGSIPSNIFTLLYFDKTLDNKLGFNSKSVRFEQIKSHNERQPTPQIQKHTTPPKNNFNPSKSPYEKSRADYMLNFDQLASPGPGYYHNYYNKDDLPLRNKLNFRYQSMFNTDTNSPRNHICPKKSNPNLGPGSYNCENGYNSLSTSMNPKVYISNVPRKEASDKQSSPRVGPGSYNLIYEYKKDNKKNCNVNLQGNKNIQSKSELIQQIKKAISDDINSSPGPGSYNICQENFKTKFNPKKYNGIQHKKLKDIKEEIKEQHKLLSKDEMKDKHLNKNISNTNENIDKRKGNNALSFKHSSKRDFSYIDPYKKHVPGPCYYEQDAFTLERKYEWAPHIRNQKSVD